MRYPEDALDLVPPGGPCYARDAWALGQALRGRWVLRRTIFGQAGKSASRCGPRSIALKLTREAIFDGMKAGELLLRRRASASCLISGLMGQSDGQRDQSRVGSGVGFFLSRCMGPNVLCVVEAFRLPIRAGVPAGRAPSTKKSPDRGAAGANTQRGPGRASWDRSLRRASGVLSASEAEALCEGSPGLCVEHAHLGAERAGDNSEKAGSP